MEERVKKVFSDLEHVRERVDDAVYHASQVVKEGGDVVHHEVPSNSKLLPYPVGHCPLSTLPLYPPPSIERPPANVWATVCDISREVKRCLATKVQNVKNRSMSDHSDRDFEE